MRGPGHAVGALRPGALRPRDDPVGLLRPGDGLVRPPPDRGPRGLRRPQAAGDLRRNHSSHMDTPTILRALPRQWRQRTAVAAAADYFYRKRWVAAAVSLLFARCRSRAAAAGSDKGSADHLAPAAWTSAGTSCCIRRARARATARAASCAPGPRSSPPPTTSRSSRSSSSGTREAMPPGRSWPRRLRAGRPFRRQPIAVRFGPPISALPGEHRNETMARVQALVRRPGRHRPDRRSARAQRRRIRRGPADDDRRLALARRPQEPPLRQRTGTGAVDLLLSARIGSARVAPGSRFLDVRGEESA